MYLSHDVAVIQWIKSCHKKKKRISMTTRVMIFWRVHVATLATTLSTVGFLFEIMIILKAIISNFKGSYDKHNLTLSDRGGLC